MAAACSHKKAPEQTTVNNNLQQLSSPQTSNSNAPSIFNGTTEQQPTVFVDSISIGTSYEISETNQRFVITGYFNPDNLIDTAFIVKLKSNGNYALLIKHCGTNQTILLKNGHDLGQDFDNFNWVEQFKITKKGTKIWNNVIDGEIVGSDKIPESKKILLKTDGIFLHVDEASGGGIVYYKDGKYTWVQVD